MRKLFSAATSLCMAATMVGALAPATAVAADSSKGYSIRTYADAALQDGVTASGSTVTVSADAIAAGDVKVPLAIYITEQTNDIKALSVAATVNSDNADVKNIRFQHWVPGQPNEDTGENYFSEAQTFTYNNGSTFTSSNVVSFAGSYSSRTGYAPSGSYTVASDTKQIAAGTENAYVGCAWTNGGSSYNWTGSKSDDYPLVVFDVTLPKGTAAGDYTIDYCNYNTDSTGKNTNPSCMIETTERFANFDGYLSNLNLDTLTITVEGDKETTTTTTGAATTTTTTTGAATTTTTTTTKGEDPKPEGDIILDLTNPDSEDGYWHYDAGETEGFVDLHFNTTNGNPIVGVSFAVDVDAPIELTGIEKVCPGLNNATLTTNVSAGEANGATIKSDGSGLVAEDGSVAVYYTFSIPADTPDGLYKIDLTKATLLKTSKPQVNYEVGIIPGYIAVGDVSDVTTTTTPAATTTTTTSAAATTTTTTSAAATTTTTTSAVAITTTTTSAAQTTTTTTTGAAGTTTGAAGTVLYGDTNVDGKVNIADVVVLNKWLNDNDSYAIKAQGKINADCFNPKNGEELTVDDSDAIIKSIVHLVELPVKG